MSRVAWLWFSGLLSLCLAILVFVPEPFDLFLGIGTIIELFASFVAALFFARLYASEVFR